MRLDKFLANALQKTRSEVKKFIAQGRVFLNGAMVKRPEIKVQDGDSVILDGELVTFFEYEYYMLNKPGGVVSATEDAKDTTVVELIKETHKKDIFPVGRLDKDTEGLLLLTNDGELAHRLLSPRKHVPKTYFVRVKGLLTKEDCVVLEQGVDIGDEKLTKPAVLQNMKYSTDEGTEGVGEQNNSTEVEIIITEGRYHQVKRMFAKVGKPVIYLKRIAMGNLRLDENLALGEYRKLTEEEVNLLLDKR